MATKDKPERTIWQKEVDLEQLNSRGLPKLAQNMGMELTEYSPSSLSATFPVDERTVQPYGILHGGASCAVAETLGSIAAYLAIKGDAQVPVGMNLVAHHMRPVANGLVKASAKPRHLGRTSQVWSIEMTDENEKLVALITFTVAIIQREPS